MTGRRALGDAFAWSALAIACTQAIAADPPQSPQDVARERIDGLLQDVESLGGDIEIEADSMEAASDGDIVIEGDVRVRQGVRTLKAPMARYSESTGAISAPGAVEIDDPKLRLRGQGATTTAQGEAEATDVEFDIPNRDGRGSADRVHISPQGELELHAARYTTCPAPKDASGRPAWELKVGRLRIDADARVGDASNVRLLLKGAPIFYLPYVSFPVGDERKTGLLFPNGGDSSRGGTALSLPWYWNIAPNYDAMLTPSWYSSRGVDAGAQFRFLTERHKGELRGNFLANDRAANRDRSFASIQTQSDFTDRLRFTTDAGNVSDAAYFEDFGVSAVSSTIVLPRTAQLQFRTQDWLIAARAQNFQVIDRSVPAPSPPYPLNSVLRGILPEYRPYTLLPQLTAHGYFPDFWRGAAASIEADFSAFQRDNSNLLSDLSGQRLELRPEARYALRGASLYLEPAIAWRYIGYRLTDSVAPLADNAPSASAPIASLDGGVAFERLTGKGKRLQTLEPRFLYVYVPYRDQANLPVFDTARPDFNLIQLFSVDRYVGGDRIGDTNHLSYGVTTRLLNAADGQQYIAATLGQTVRYSTPKVTLPGETPDIYDRSDVIGDVALTAYRHWSAQASMQWNPNQRRTERLELGFRYLPSSDAVVNLSYRFRKLLPQTPPQSQAQPEIQAIVPESLKQADLSFAAPLWGNVRGLGRVAYSLRDQRSTETFAGFEYRSCCWAMRLVAGHTLATRESKYDSWLRWQFELKGLSSVGSADTFLTQSIPGYSQGRFESRPPQ